MGLPDRRNRACGMKWRVVSELVGADRTTAVHEVSGGAAVAEYVPRMIGPMLAKGMRMLAVGVTPSCSGANGGSLPLPTTLSTLRRAASPQR